MQNNRSNEKKLKHDATLPNLASPRKFDDEEDDSPLSFREFLHGHKNSILSYTENVLFVEVMLVFFA